MELLTLTDFIFAPVALLIIYVLARVYSIKKVKENPEFKYFLPGLRMKLFGGIGVCLVYTIYYPGGDTLQYYNDALCIVKLALQSPGSAFHILFYPYDPNSIWLFNSETGYPAYLRDKETWFVVKLAFPFVLLSFKSFVVSTILLATASFLGVWRLYRVFILEFPQLEKQFAISIFFIPSVFFWGSGLLKDTFTLSAIGFLTHSYYFSFIKKKKSFRYIITFALSLFIILSIKPYIFIGLLPGMIFWMVHSLLAKIKGGIARVAAIPLFVILGIGSGYLLLNLLSSQLAEYSMDTVLEKAVIQQRDLKMDYYRGNSFDIGDFDPTIGSMAQKAPAAIFATLFRPFILEVNNAVMFISSIENLIVLIFTIRVLWMVRIIGIFRFLLKQHLLTFSLIFSFFFAFSVGISTSNFGSLVRYKIPCLPFYISALFIIRHLRQKEIDESKTLQLNFENI
ncbi:hypothetical protein BH11BAC2_BH11BAC2_04370 [soil metagenome]